MRAEGGGGKRVPSVNALRIEPDVAFREAGRYERYVAFEETASGALIGRRPASHVRARRSLDGSQPITAALSIRIRIRIRVLRHNSINRLYR